MKKTCPGQATAMAISLGPTSLYPDKPSPKNNPFFGTLKKNDVERDFAVEFVVEALQPNRREGSDSKRSSRANGVSPSLLEL